MDDFDWSEHDRVMSDVFGRRLQRGQERLKQDLERLETLLAERKKASNGLSSSEWLRTQLVDARDVESCE